MLAPDDLAAYLARIGYEGPREPTRAVLASLQLAHLEAIPFESADSFGGRVPAIDLPSILDKLVRSRRGGYCYEHNTLFKAALESFGFRPVGLMGRVLLGRPEDADAPRTHMLLRVEAEGEDLVADVGFGGQVPTGPLRLVSGIAQETPHEPCRLEDEGGTWLLRALVGGEWRALYRFSLEAAHPSDYAVANHWVATHPDSVFVRALVAVRILPRERLTLLNRRLTSHPVDGASRGENISGDGALRAVLAERFGIEVDDGLWHDVTRRLG